MLCDELRFGESLTQEVAYEGHACCASGVGFTPASASSGALPGETTGERAALLAHHFARSDDRERAVGALLTAAREAERIPSFRAAAGHYRDAFEMAEGLLQAGATDADLLRRTLQAAYGLCRMAIMYGVAGLEEAERAGRRGRQLAEQLDDTEAFVDLCSLQGGFGMSSRERAKFEAGFAMAEEGLGVARRAGLVVPAGPRFPHARLGPPLRWTRRAGGAARSNGDRRAGAGGSIPIGLRISRSASRDARDRIAYYRDDTGGDARTRRRHLRPAVRVSNRTLQTVAAPRWRKRTSCAASTRPTLQWVEKSLGVALAIGNVGATRSAAQSGCWSAWRSTIAGPTARYLDLLEQGPTGNLEPLTTAIMVEALLAAGAVTQAEQHAEAAYASRRRTFAGSGGCAPPRQRPPSRRRRAR